MKLKKIFCIFGLHHWKYKREKHKVENHPTERQYIRVLIRECKICGHREHHINPKNLGLVSWENYDHIKNDETIKL